MRIVIFTLVKNESLIVYPDDISLFSNTEILGDNVVGFYSGELPLDDYTPPVPPQPDIKIEMWEKIKANRDERMNGGFKVEVEPEVFKWFHSDISSRVQHLGLMMAGAALPAIPWKTMDSTFQTMTPEIATAIFQSALTLDGTLFAVAEQHKVAMEESEDPANYDFSTGWPENFLGL